MPFSWLKRKVTSSSLMSSAYTSCDVPRVARCSKRYSEASTLKSTHRWPILRVETELGRGCDKRYAGKQVVLDWIFKMTDLAHTCTAWQIAGQGNFTDAENRLTNALRHFDRTNVLDFDADLEESTTLAGAVRLKDAISGWSRRRAKVCGA